MNTNGLDLTYEDFYIGKKRRKISNPSEDLKRYQRSKLKMLEKEYKKLISGSEIENVAHGFVRNRNCAGCAHRHIGYEMTIMLDISKFFDSVTKEMVETVHYEIAQDRYFFHKEGYTAQGFPTSPILANIASIPLIDKINQFLKQVYKENYAFTIYADDIQISLNRIMPLARREENIIINKIAEFAKEHKLIINKNKTRVRYAKYGYRRILGINVGENGIRASRKTMKRIRAAEYQGNYQSLGGLTAWSHCSLPKRDQHISRKKKEKE